MQIDTATRKAIDRCLLLGIPFFAVRTAEGNFRFGASTSAQCECPVGIGFFIGAFNRPWSENLWIPGELSAEQVCGIDSSNAPSATATRLPRPTDKSQYLSSLVSVISALKLRGTAKTVISMVRKCALPSFKISDLYANLANRSAGCFAYVCFTPAFGCWMGAPPEILVKTCGLDRFETMALAGTLPADSPAWDDKNAVEHQIVVDYIMHNLSAIGVKPVKGPRQTLAYGSIKHLHTPISGSLGGHKASDIYDALNPTPALCGYPKDEALADIRRTEMHQRDCYGGCIGLKLPDSSVQAYVNIRCCRIAGGEAYCFGGGGITPDSVPEDEWDEANSKIDNFLTRINP